MSSNVSSETAMALCEDYYAFVYQVRSVEGLEKTLTHNKDKSCFQTTWFQDRRWTEESLTNDYSRHIRALENRLWTNKLTHILNPEYFSDPSNAATAGFKFKSYQEIKQGQKAYVVNLTQITVGMEEIEQEDERGETVKKAVPKIQRIFATVDSIIIQTFIPLTLHDDTVPPDTTMALCMKYYTLVYQDQNKEGLEQIQSHDPDKFFSKTLWFDDGKFRKQKSGNDVIRDIRFLEKYLWSYKANDVKKDAFVVCPHDSSIVSFSFSSDQVTDEGIKARVVTTTQIMVGMEEVEKGTGIQQAFKIQRIFTYVDCEYLKQVPKK